MTLLDSTYTAGDTARFAVPAYDYDGGLLTGLTGTIDIEYAGALVVTAQAISENIVLPGWYYYDHVTASAGPYSFNITLSNGLVGSGIIAVGTGGSALEATSQAILADTANLDVVLSTRATPADITNATANLDIAVSTRATNQGVWANETRALTTFGTLISDIWAFANRALSAFGFTVTTDSASREASKADVSGLASSAEIAALNDLSADDVWVNAAARTLTSSAGITEAEFHEYLQSYPASIPAGEQPAMPLPPESSAVVLVYKYCKNKDDTVLAAATPTCQLLEYTSRDGKSYYVTKEAMTYSSESGLAQFYVPAYSYIRVIIPEIGMDEAGFVGAGNNSIEADNLYAERQI